MEAITLRNKYRKSPCKECEERKSGCHSTCEKYKEYRESIDHIKNEKKKEAEINNYVKTRVKKGARH